MSKLTELNLAVDRALSLLGRIRNGDVLTQREAYTLIAAVQKAVYLDRAYPSQVPLDLDESPETRPSPANRRPDPQS